MTEPTTTRENTESSHPIGTGVGAASAGAAGMAIGSLAGPVGALIGGAVGAIAGGYAGHEVAEAMDPTGEDNYWRENYRTRSYVGANDSYDRWQPAYAYGWEARRRTLGDRWEDVEDRLESSWDRFEDKTEMKWEQAKDAVRDGWNRVERKFDNMFDDDEKEARTRYAQTPYSTTGEPFDYYKPAYRYGASHRLRSLGQRWEDAEDDLESRWERFEDKAEVKWEQAKAAARDGWHSIERRLPGDFDNDGR